MLNVCVIEGRFVADPVLNTTKTSGVPVCSFALACERDVSRQAENYAVDFINFSAWKQVAERITRNCHKGDKIIVVGRLGVRSWDGIDKNTHQTTEITVDKFYFESAKKKDGYLDVEVDSTPTGKAPSRPTSKRTARFTELDDDGELPF